jgi:hypothetical protein
MKADQVVAYRAVLAAQVYSPSSPAGSGRLAGGCGKGLCTHLGLRGGERGVELQTLGRGTGGGKRVLE